VFQRVILVLLIVISVQAQFKFDFLKQLFYENESGKYNLVLVKGLNEVLLLSKNAQEQAELHWLLAKVQMKLADTTGAILNLSKLVYLYPKTDYTLSALDQLDSLKLKHKLPDFFYSDSIEPPLYIDLQERRFGFISDFYSLNSRYYDRELIDEMGSFLNAYPNSIYEELLLLWQAQLYLNIDQPYFAENIYRVLILRKPAATVKAQALLALARLNAGHLKDFERAEQYYLELIGSHSELEYGGTGQYELGLLYADSLKDFEAAESQLKLFQLNYSGHSHFADALKQLGQINEIQQNWAESCNYYQLFYEQAPLDSFAIEALAKIETIALNQLKNYQQTVVVLLLEARVLNDVNKLLQAAKIYLDKLNDKQKAQQILNRIIKEYPNTEAEQKAQELLEQIE